MNLFLIGITRNVGVEIIVVTSYIPVVDFCIRVRIFTFHRIESGRRAVVDDKTVAAYIGVIQWEDEVTGGFQEAVGVFTWYFMNVVSIHISTTFTLTGIHQVHLYDTIDRTIVDRLLHLLGVWVDGFLCILNLQGITRGDANHILCRTVVALLEFCYICHSTFFILLDASFFEIQICLRFSFTILIIPLLREQNIGFHGTYIMNVVGKTHIVACLACIFKDIRCLGVLRCLGAL